MATKPLQQDEEGRIMNDTETKKAQKGYSNYEKENQQAQKEMETKDAKFKESVKSGFEKVRGALGFKKGGKVSCCRGDGIAKKGKTKGRMV